MMMGRMVKYMMIDIYYICYYYYIPKRFQADIKDHFESLGFI